LITVLAGFLVSVSVFAAPRYTQSVPLKDKINVAVGNVKSGQVELPVITWGADIRTLHANGDARTTQKGSIFDQLGLDMRLVREDDFSKQVENYLTGRTPYLRGTLGMINMAAEVASADLRTKPVVIYQLSESAGGDALVVKEKIKKAKDLCGKTIAVQAYGPHVDYLGTVLEGAGCTLKEVTIKWLPDLTATDNSPMAAFYESDVDAAMVIIPDALALTSGGTVGTGSEDSVRDARILLSTKTANRVIADVYAVRADYFKQHPDQVEKFVSGLMQAQEATAKLVANRSGQSADYRQMMTAAGDILLDSAQAAADAEALYADAEHMGFSGNVKFFTDSNYPRNFDNRTRQGQAILKSAGVMRGTVPLTFAGWDYAALRSGLTQTQSVSTPRFDPSKVASVVARKQQQGSLDDGTIFQFEVFFKPNQNEFSADFYQQDFDRVIDLASTYGGALITVEGHSDPMGYLRKKKAGDSDLVLRRIQQAAKNLSLSRANSVRDSIIAYAQKKSINLDSTQFATVGHGIMNPTTGMCGKEPCAPKTEQEWLSNMRVQFRIIQVEAESSVFKPL
jgi:ABC-type nitrate/sulfonate/bicarbonate transport system substrate-binding protein